MVVLIALVYEYWDIIVVGFLRSNVGLQVYSMFYGNFWSRSKETSKEEEGDQVLKASPLAEDAGTVDSAGMKSMPPEIYVEALSYMQRFLEVIIVA